MEIQHMLGFLLLTILGLLGQGFALVGDGGGVMNKTIAAGYISGNYIRASPILSDSGIINTNDSTSASVCRYNWSITTQLTSTIKTHTSLDINTSWIPITVVDAITETIVIKPITTTETIVKVSTIETTTTSTAKYALSTKTFTNAIIAGFSTETIYTSTWLAPPKEVSYTLTRTSTSVSEAIVVPTDVTYIITSVPPAPTPTIITHSLPTLIKRTLTGDESFANTTADLCVQNDTGVSARATTLNATGIDNGETRTLTIQGFGPGSSTPVLAGDVTAAHSNVSCPNSTTASLSIRWATKSNASLSGQPTTTTEFISAHWTIKSDASLGAEPITTFSTQRVSTSDPSRSEQAVSPLSIDSQYPTTTVVSVFTHLATKSDESLSGHAVTSVSADSQYPTTMVVPVSAQWATRSDTSLGGLAVLSVSVGSQYTDATSISKDDYLIVDVTGATTLSSDGATPTAAILIPTRPLHSHNSNFTMTANQVPVTTVPSTTITTTDLVIVTITLDDDGTIFLLSTGSGATSTMSIPSTTSGGAGSKAISTVFLVLLGLLLVIT